MKDNAAIFEQADTQRLVNQVSEDVQTEAAVSPEGPMPQGIDNMQ